MFLILDGIVGIYKTNKANGDFYEVAQLRQGQQFGEISLIDDGPRSATVKALVDTNLVYISKEAFQSFLATSMEMRVRFYQNCAKELAVRLRNLDEHYVVSQYQLWKTMLQAPKEAA